VALRFGAALRLAALRLGAAFLFAATLRFGAALRLAALRFVANLFPQSFYKLFCI
jgi:hypothetical protein